MTQPHPLHRIVLNGVRSSLLAASVFLTTRVIADRLTTDRYDLWVKCIAAAGLVLLVEPGLAGITVRRLSAVANEAEFRQEVRRLRRLSAAVTGAAVVLTMLIVLVHRSLVRVPTGSQGSGLAIAILGLALAVQIPAAVNLGLVQIGGRISALGLGQVLIRGIHIAALAVGLRPEAPVFQVALTFFAAAVASLLLSEALSRSVTVPQERNDRRPMISAKSEFIISLFWSGCFFLITQVDSLLVAHFDPERLVPFWLGATAAAAIVGLVQQVIQPLVGLMALRENDEQVTASWMTVYADIAALICFATAAIPASLLYKLLGARYAVSAMPYFYAVMAGSCIRIVCYPVSVRALSRASRSRLLLGALPETLTTFAVSVVLAVSIGAFGPPIGTGVGVAVAYLFQPMLVGIRIPDRLSLVGRSSGVLVGVGFLSYLAAHPAASGWIRVAALVCAVPFAIGVPGSKVIRGLGTSSTRRSNSAIA